MKTKVWIIFVFLIFALSGFARNEKVTGKTDVSDNPLISFNETEYDFGTVEYGGDAVHYFVFSNIGTFPLAISNVNTSCGCAVSEWPKAPVGGGAKDSLRVEYNTKIKGVFNKTITVHSNAVNAPVDLIIRGNVLKVKKSKQKL